MNPRVLGVKYKSANKNGNHVNENAKVEMWRCDEIWTELGYNLEIIRNEFKRESL